MLGVEEQNKRSGEFGIVKEGGTNIYIGLPVGDSRGVCGRSGLEVCYITLRSQWG